MTQAFDPSLLHPLQRAFAAGRYREVLDSGCQLLARHPGQGEVLRLLGCACHALGEHPEAVNYLLEAAASLPGDALVFSQLGDALVPLGNWEAALEAHRAAVALAPRSPECRARLGHALLERGERLAALEQFWLAFDLAPADRDLAAQCRVLVAETGDQKLLWDFCDLNVKRLPDDGEALAILGGLLLLDGQEEAAAACLGRAVASEPGSVLAWSNLSVALQRLDRLDEAIDAGRRAAALGGTWAAPHNNLGLALKDKGCYGEAESCLRKALELDPAYAEAWNNLGLVLQMQGRVADAEPCFRQAFALRPDYFGARSNLLFLLNYSSDYSQECRLVEARQFGAALAASVSRYTAWDCDPAPERLRVGLVSGDLRNHPVGYFLESFLARVDPRAVELVAYPTTAQADALTERLRPVFAAWVPLYDLDDAGAADLIHSQGVHLLLDLSGHTDRNRLPVFARKPAPVQATWLGYFATTGLAEMDYLLADRTGVPEEARGAFVEQIRYLPETRLCFAAPVDAPAVAPLPAAGNGVLTLGSFQNLSKMEEPVFRLWAAVLTDLPGARLRLQCTQLGDPEVCARVRATFAALGVAPERLILCGPMSRAAYLAAHAEVDFILDTFPYPGGTTTCEALWMGVPTLTLAGDSMLARQGASLMTAAGLPDWVAADPAAYLAKARALAGDLPALAALRAGLREHLVCSPLFDGQAFADHFTLVLRSLWEEHRRTSLTHPTLDT